jgi:hypothetical protein
MKERTMMIPHNLTLEYVHLYPKRKRYDLAVLDDTDTVVFSAEDVSEQQLKLMGAFFSAVHELEAAKEINQ